MPCYSPLTAWTALDHSKVVFSSSKALNPDHPLSLPCGQCIGCRLERSRQWAIRCLHESQLYKENAFITLTFNQETLKKRGNPYTVRLRDFQLFMKRLRKNTGRKIRFFHCGEYGDKNRRPHYHACLFNYDFPDKKLWSTQNKIRLYTSEILEATWQHQGFCTIGDVTFQSAAYVARYIMKKITGERAADHYKFIDPETGEVFDLEPEYTSMSKKPGLGKGWFEKYSSDVFPSDQIIINGKKSKPPRYYDSQYEIVNPDDLTAILKTRRSEGRKHKKNNTPERLKTREICQHLKLDLLPRNHDN